MRERRSPAPRGDGKERSMNSTTASTSGRPTTARLEVGGKTIDLPVTVGTEGEVGIDIQKLRTQTGAITLDPGYGNTGSCRSAITFIDGEKGILRYPGYPTEQLAEKATFPQGPSPPIYAEL